MRPARLGGLISTPHSIHPVRVGNDWTAISQQGRALGASYSVVACSPIRHRMPALGSRNKVRPHGHTAFLVGVQPKPIVLPEASLWDVWGWWGGSPGALCYLTNRHNRPGP